MVHPSNAGAVCPEPSLISSALHSVTQEQWQHWVSKLQTCVHHIMWAIIVLKTQSLVEEALSNRFWDCMHVFAIV